MTWQVVLVLAAGIYGLRLLGMFVLSRGIAHPTLERLARLVPVTVIASVVALQTFTRGRELVVDARALGLAVAALLAWRRAPLIVTVLGAAAVTAIARQVA